MLSCLLAPWSAAVVSDNVRAWAYADDRSLKAFGETIEDAVKRIDDAIATTVEFDAGIGLVENSKKRQRWRGEETCEHLGLTVQPEYYSETEHPDVPAPRDGGSALRRSPNASPLYLGPARYERVSLLFASRPNSDGLHP